MAERRHGASLSPVEARLKLAVQKAIRLAGGSEEAAAAADRAYPTVKEWDNLNHGQFPPADCLLAIDQIARCGGHEPPIVSALCRELGGVFVPHVDVLADEGSLAGMVMQLSKELGDVAGAISIALADDNRVSPLEADAALRELEDMARKQAQLRTALEAIRGDS